MEKKKERDEPHEKLQILTELEVDSCFGIIRFVT